MYAYLRFRHGTTLSDRTAADKRQGAWSMRTVLDLHQGRARSDLLFTMSDNTRPGQTQTDAKSFSLLDERSAVMEPAEGPMLAIAASRQTQTLHRRRTPTTHKDSRRADSRHLEEGNFDRRSGGARRDRTDDLLLAKQALSQLSYGPPFSDQHSEVSNQNQSHLITDI